MLEKKLSERKFISQLLDPKTLEPFEIPVKVNAELRKYQQDGINWLAFLNKYSLHGILCDGIALHDSWRFIFFRYGLRQDAPDHLYFVE